MLFVWKWSPILLGFVALLVTYGIIQGIRRFWPGEEWTWSRWWSYKYGDLFIAGYVVLAAICFHHNWPNGWYTILPFHIMLFAVGMAITFGIQLNELNSGHMTREVFNLPSEWYHTFMRGFLIYFVAQSATTLVFGSRQPAWAFVLALLCLLSYVGMFVYDSSSGQDHTTVTRGNR